MPTPKEVQLAGGRKAWRVRFRHGGKETSETFYVKRDALAFCSDIEHHGIDFAVRQREQSQAIDTSPPLDEVAEEFFAWKNPRAKSDRTVADYRRDYLKAISDTFGRRPVGSITEDDVQHWVDAMVSGKAAARTIKGRPQPLSPKSIGDRHALLHQIMKYAASSSGGRIIESNPCKDTSLPERRKRPAKGLRPAEWAALHHHLALSSSDAADLAEFMLASGWRWSEATALDAWGVDDDGYRIRCTMGRVLRRNAAGQHILVEDDGKRDSSLRTITLDADASAMVRRRVAAQGMGLVFRTPISPQNGLGGNQWHYSNFLRRYWNPAVEAAGLTRRPTPHWLRHTHVAWAAMSGANLAQLSKRLGHAKIDTTIDVYGSMIEDVSPETLDAFAALRRQAPPVLGSSRPLPRSIPAPGN
jgi:integrase